jgi:hypothetical protein
MNEKKGMSRWSLLIDSRTPATLPQALGDLTGHETSTPRSE